MCNKQDDVVAFHDKFNAHVERLPKFPPNHILELRKKLIKEEAKEVSDAIDGSSLAEVAKELCDLLYVTYGTAVAFGINLDPIWKEVQQSNMAKTGGKHRADGKVLKPDNWVDPKEKIAREIINQVEKG